MMHLLSHDDPNVRYEALLAVQKLMVHNWYVGCSLLSLKIQNKLIIPSPIIRFKYAVKLQAIHFELDCIYELVQLPA